MGLKVPTPAISECTTKPEEGTSTGRQMNLGGTMKADSSILTGRLLRGSGANTLHFKPLS